MSETRKRIRTLFCACHAILAIAALVMFSINIIMGKNGQAIPECAMMIYHVARFMRSL